MKEIKDDTNRLKDILCSWIVKINIVKVTTVPREIYRMENPEINPNTYGKFIYDKGGMTIPRRKYGFFNKWYWESWTATC